MMLEYVKTKGLPHCMCMFDCLLLHVRFGRLFVFYFSMIVTPLAACAPMTRACAMSAVFDGPLIKQP